MYVCVYACLRVCVSVCVCVCVAVCARTRAEHVSVVCIRLCGMQEHVSLFMYE